MFSKRLVGRTTWIEEKEKLQLKASGVKDFQRLWRGLPILKSEGVCFAECYILTWVYLHLLVNNVCDVKSTGYLPLHSFCFYHIICRYHIIQTEQKRKKCPLWICNLDKCISWFEQIHYSNWTNTISKDDGKQRGQHAACKGIRRADMRDVCGCSHISSMLHKKCHNVNKYVWQFREIHFAIWTNTFWNHYSTVEDGSVKRNKGSETRWGHNWLFTYILHFAQINVIICTNTFCNLNKSILQQIWTKLFHRQQCAKE